jgi:hypothetical protein
VTTLSNVRSNRFHESGCSSIPSSSGVVGLGFSMPLPYRIITCPQREQAKYARQAAATSRTGPASASRATQPDTCDTA